jgi:hypothetical protein
MIQTKAVATLFANNNQTQAKLLALPELAQTPETFSARHLERLEAAG